MLNYILISGKTNYGDGTDSLKQELMKRGYGVKTCLGRYQGESETSLLVQIDEPGSWRYTVQLQHLLALGKQFGQESILVSTEGFNSLIECQSGGIIASGRGLGTFDPENHTVVDGVEFTLNLGE